MERMTDAVLIFTFGPVQSFIAEARRAADLFVGSRILAQLAVAASKALTSAGGDLIYPADLAAGDAPNKLVVRLPFERADAAARAARDSLWDAWRALAQEARTRLARLDPSPDAAWEEIWERQIGRLWEVYWASARMEEDTASGYREAYNRASETLAAVKTTRAFEQAEEPGEKDSLSGRRSALRTHSLDARAYWRGIGTQVTASKLRPDGRERLDAIGAVKRFCGEADKPFPSTSTVAAADFLAAAHSLPELSAYRAAVEQLLGEHLFRVSNDEDWPYDGDLLFSETLQPERLARSYGLATLDAHGRQQAEVRLKDLYRAASCRPSPYYAVLLCDGDDMGRAIQDILESASPLDGHCRFGQQLAAFAKQVKALSERSDVHLIYNGGDDVLALTSLKGAVATANSLVAAFAEAVPGRSASVGIAVAHHLYPLDAALTAARAAEREAKGLAGKGAVCLRVMRRSGETYDARCRWKDLDHQFERLVTMYAEDQLGGRIPYELLAEAPVVGVLDEAAQRAWLRRLLKRQSRLEQPDAYALAEQLADWAFAMGGALSTTPPEDGAAGAARGLTELARWLIAARFIAQGGAE
jgi:CRISPR-associated protein Cmr2